MPLDFIPQPQKVNLAKGSFKIPSKPSIGISGHSVYGVARCIQKMLKGGAISICVPSILDPVRILVRPDMKARSYRIDISPNGILIEAYDVTTSFHAAQTLGQIVSQSKPGTLPHLEIEDWPDFEDRGLYYDICRGRVPTLEEFKKQADLLSRYKINQIQYYIEHTFAFRQHPEIGKNASPLVAEDILAMDAFCLERHIDFVPSLASFGHMGNILTLPKYRDMAEDLGINKYVDPEMKNAAWWQRQAGWTLSPANPKIYDFLDSLFAEFLPLFSSPRFNVCCDETFDLGTGQSYDLCRERGKGHVYLDHIIRLNELCMKYGKKMMFWGDIIRHYPDLISGIPADVTVLDWGYGYNHPFAAISDFRAAKLGFYACPGTGGWNGLFPRIHEARMNIAGFAAAGKENGAKGLLNTDWGDGGHSNFMEYSWHGYLFGAEQAWNTSADQSDFTRRFCKLFLNATGADFVKAIEELGDYSHPLQQHVFFMAPDDPWLANGHEVRTPGRNGKLLVNRMDAAYGTKTRARLEAIKGVFKAYANKKHDPNCILSYWIFAVDTLIAAARKLELFGKGGECTPAQRRQHKREMQDLQKRFEKLWMAHNQTSEIRITLERYRKAIAAL